MSVKSKFLWEKRFQRGGMWGAKVWGRWSRVQRGVRASSWYERGGGGGGYNEQEYQVQTMTNCNTIPQHVPETPGPSTPILNTTINTDPIPLPLTLPLQPTCTINPNSTLTTSSINEPSRNYITLSFFLSLVRSLLWVYFLLILFSSITPSWYFVSCNNIFFFFKVGVFHLRLCFYILFPPPTPYALSW